MLKVVGASWLQTRISTYILVAVAVLGVGAIILGEFGHIEQDGIYSATVSWNYKGGYRIDFLGQGNDLTAVPLHAARAYYKTGIFESGWSYIEIETSSKYSDEVQAYAAGLLEGSLTWQLIHHHWYNTVKPVCEEKVADCRKLARYLRDNTIVIRERARLLESTDPFWHMVLLFYTQLDGLEAGWKFAVRRSRQTVSMETEDFLWLALASDLPGFERTFNISNPRVGSRVLFKALPRDTEPLIAIGHNTAASYTRMLRLVKKYTFGYHVLPAPKTAALVPSRSLVMSSYPGALSSQDEFYLMEGKNRELIITGTPLQTANQSQWAFLYSKDHVMLSMRVMAANRLAIDSQTWFQTLSYQNGGASALQWIAFEPRTTSVLLVEQLPSITVAMNYTEEFQKTGYIAQNGLSNFNKIQEILRPANEDTNSWSNRVARLQENITTLEQFQNLMRGCSQEEFHGPDQDSSIQSNLLRKLFYRGDLEDEALAFGIIDTKILAVDVDGIETFEVTSGPVTSESWKPFKWSETFPNISHIGHPDVFNFDSVTPLWVWI